MSAARAECSLHSHTHQKIWKWRLRRSVCSDPRFGSHPSTAKPPRGSPRRLCLRPQSDAVYAAQRRLVVGPRWDASVRPRKNSTAPNVRLFGATPGAPERCPPIMSPFMYRCPDTGLRVPSFESTKTSDGTYDVVTCVACGRVHLIDPATGKVPGQDKERAASFTGGCAVGRMFSVGVKKPRRRARLSAQRAEMPMPTDKV
jgi:hypothetical protein